LAATLPTLLVDPTTWFQAVNLAAVTSAHSVLAPSPALPLLQASLGHVLQLLMLLLQPELLPVPWAHLVPSALATMLPTLLVAVLVLLSPLALLIAALMMPLALAEV